MIKHILLIVGLLLLSSCSSDMDNKSNITKTMESYIIDHEDGSYGFFEINVIKEHTDCLNWKSDIFRIQKDVYLYASQRRIAIANSYISIPNLSIWEYSNSYGLVFEEPQGYGKQIKNSYITKEERDVCDYIYYKKTLPQIKEIVKKLSEEDFHGDRIYYACGYRITSGAIKKKQFVLYKEDNNDSFTICELKYNYDMLREFVQYTLNINMKDSNIQTLITKYDEEDKSDGTTWGIISSPVTQKYEYILKRLM